MEFVILKVQYDPNLVSPDFMAENVFDLEGVETVHIEDAD